MTPSENTRFRRNNTVASQEIASATVVVTTRNGIADLDTIFSFNPIGAELWELMDQEVSLGEMASWVESQYDVSRQTALADIRIFVDALVAAGLASVSSRSTVGQFLEDGVHASRAI